MSGESKKMSSVIVSGRRESASLATDLLETCDIYCCGITQYLYSCTCRLRNTNFEIGCSFTLYVSYLLIYLLVLAT